MSNEHSCLRCQRPNPEFATDGMPVDWEVMEDDKGNIVGVICPGCVTGSEEQAADEDMMAVAAAAERFSSEEREFLEDAVEALDFLWDLDAARGLRDERGGDEYERLSTPRKIRRMLDGDPTDESG